MKPPSSEEIGSFKIFLGPKTHFLEKFGEGSGNGFLFLPPPSPAPQMHQGRRESSSLTGEVRGVIEIDYFKGNFGTKKRFFGKNIREVVGGGGTLTINRLLFCLPPPAPYTHHM